MSHALPARSLRRPAVLALIAALLVAGPALAGPSEQDYAPVKEKLDKKISVQLLDTPFDRAIEFIQREATGVTFLVDRKRLHHTLKLPVSLQAEGMSIRRTLDWITHATDNDWDVRDGVVIVSTPSEIVRPHVTLRVFDVRALTQTVPDFENTPRPSIDQSLSNTNSGGSTTEGVAEQSTTLFGKEPGLGTDVAGIEGDNLTDLIKHSTPEGRWDELVGVSATLNNGILMVRHTPSVHDKIADLLDAYHKAYGKMVSIDAHFVQMRSEALEQQLAKSGGKLVLTADQAEAFLKAARGAGGGGKVVGVGRVVCFNAQRVELTAGSEQAFVSDVEPIPDAPGLDPTLSVSRNGAFLRIRPTVAFDNSSISLLFGGDVIAGGGMSSAHVPYGGVDERVALRSTGSVKGKTTPDDDSKAKKHPPSEINGSVALNGQLRHRGAVRLGVAELGLPQQDLVRYRTMARVPDGGAIVLSGSSSQFAHAQADGTELVVIVRARVAE